MKAWLGGIVILMVIFSSVHAASNDHMHGMHDQHARHKASLDNKKIKRSFAHYHYDNAMLTRADGASVSVDQLFHAQRPVVLNFIFTTCATICPVLSATFSQLQGDLSALEQPPLMLSISIDPEQDTPARLRDYARKFDALPLWTFYTGSRADIEALQRSFDIYRGNKVNHIPVTFIKATDSNQWLRIDGFVSKKHLLEEYKSLVGS